MLDLGPGRSHSLPPNLASQAPLPKPAIPSSCFLCASRPPAGARGAASLAPGAASRPGMAAAGQGGKMSSQLWNRSLWRWSAKESLSFIAWVSCGGKWAFPSYQPSLIPVYWVRRTAFWDNLGNSGAGAVVFAGHPGSGAVGHRSPVSTRECF